MKNKNRIISLLSDVIDLLMEEDKKENLTVVEELPFQIDKEKFPNEMQQAFGEHMHCICTTKLKGL
jgi:hypothetical protein